MQLKLVFKKGVEQYKEVDCEFAPGELPPRYGSVVYSQTIGSFKNNQKLVKRVIFFARGKSPRVTRSVFCNAINYL